MQGYIKLYRKILDSPVWGDPYYLKLWLYCLIKATHTEREVIIGNQTITLKPGEFITGRKALTQELNAGMKPKQKLNESTWWRYLNNLEKLQMLNIKKTNKFSVVTILNWVEYQETGHQMNIKRTTDEHQMNTNNNVKNVKNDKEYIPYTEIVEFLNEKAGKNFKSTTRKTRELIRARWNEGYRLEDFKKVIEICCEKWKGKTFSNGRLGDDYLQPSTLFNNKFDERLNWSIRQDSKVTPLRRKPKEQLEHEKMMRELGMV